MDVISPDSNITLGNVMRVPGGWIYGYVYAGTLSKTFVPYTPAEFDNNGNYIVPEHIYRKF